MILSGLPSQIMVSGLIPAKPLIVVEMECTICVKERIFCTDLQNRSKINNGTTITVMFLYLISRSLFTPSPSGEKDRG